MQRRSLRLLAVSILAGLAALVTIAACTGEDAAKTVESDEPDATATDAETDAADAADSAPPPFYVFITEGTWKGQEVGGLAGADGKCQAEAESAGLTGRYQSWLDGEKVGFDTRMATDGGPWLRMDGEEIFHDFSRLHTAPAVPLRYTAKKGTLPAGTHFWTGQLYPDASPGGTESVDCASWTSSDAGLLGVYGDPEGTKFDWTFLGRDTCDQALHLVCIRAEPYKRNK